MNGGSYLKFILTLLTLAVIVFGYLGVSALDRLHRVNVKLLEKLNTPSAVSAAVPETVQKKAELKGSVIANKRFYDPAAVTGGRLIQAVEAEPPNLNPIICNEASASRFYGLCSSALAERSWDKPEEFEALLAESWSISKDNKEFKIKLRRNVMWQSFMITLRLCQQGTLNIMLNPAM